MAHRRGNRAPFGRSTARAAKKAAGSTAATETPLSIRTSGLDVGDEMRDRTRSKMGAKLGKFAERIERLTVRFEDINGPRGGVDTVCRVKVVLSGLDAVVFETRADDAPSAMQKAAAGIERAVRRTLGRAGGGTRASTTRRKAIEPQSRTTAATASRRGGPKPAAGSLIGRRVGRNQDNVDAALERPEKERRDQPVDTAQPGVSATDRRAGGGSTARRNSKGNDAGFTSTLEDSVQDRPSRKSTRKSANRGMQDSNLRLRETRRVTSPAARAARSAATGH